MTEKRFLLLFGLITLMAFVIAGPSSAKMPPGSFITKPIANGGELGDLVVKDKITGLRYSQHYGKTQDELATYFRENLKVSKLSKTQTVTSYYITKSGRTVSHKKTLKAGTPVFVSPTGELVMEFRCGNPLSKTLPKIVSEVKATKEEIVTPTPVVPDPVPEPVPTPVAAEPIVEMPPIEVAAAPVEPAVPLPVQEAVLPALPIEIAGPRAFNWVVPTLLGAGAVGTLVGGGSSSPPVPEPASIMILGMGVVTLASQCYKKRIR